MSGLARTPRVGRTETLPTDRPTEYHKCSPCQPTDPPIMDGLRKGAVAHLQVELCTKRNRGYWIRGSIAASLMYDTP